MTIEKPNANTGIRLTEPGTEPPPQNDIFRLRDRPRTKSDDNCGRAWNGSGSL
jgi:hypothetical protein